MGGGAVGVQWMREGGGEGMPTKWKAGLGGAMPP